MKEYNKNETMIITELQALNMLARKHSEESALAGYVLGMTDKMIKDIEEIKNNG